MKQFEKQLKKQYSQPSVSSPIFDVGFKNGWKAALEWALSLEWENDDGAKAISSARLRRELKEDG